VFLSPENAAGQSAAMTFTKTPPVDGQPPRHARSVFLIFLIDKRVTQRPISCVRVSIPAILSAFTGSADEGPSLTLSAFPF
jgi:hypothetical protein